MRNLQQDKDFITKEEAKNQYVSREECVRNKMQILEKITEQEKQNIIQDNEISNLQKAVDKFSNGINKLIWTGAGLIITTIWEIIQTYFSMKG